MILRGQEKNVPIPVITKGGPGASGAGLAASIIERQPSQGSRRRRRRDIHIRPKIKPLGPAVTRIVVLPLRSASNLSWGAGSYISRHYSPCETIPTPSKITYALPAL